MPGAVTSTGPLQANTHLDSVSSPEAFGAGGAKRVLNSALAGISAAQTRNALQLAGFTNIAGTQETAPSGPVATGEIHAPTLEWARAALPNAQWEFDKLTHGKNLGYSQQQYLEMTPEFAAKQGLVAEYQAARSVEALSTALLRHEVFGDASGLAALRDTA